MISARRKLVEGAVCMVEMALIDISEKSLATFTPAQKVALVTNLMTVLVGDAQTPPVLQIGGRGSIAAPCCGDSSFSAVVLTPRAKAMRRPQRSAGGGPEPESHYPS